MTTKRTNSPVAAPAVPWGQPPVVNGGVPTPAVEFDNSGASPLAEDLKSLFAPPPTHGKSVFAPPPKKVEKEPEPEFSMEGAPSWAELVRFVQQHGKVILQVRYPRPLGEAIDTLWRGVTVIKFDGTQIRHETHGWIDWKDAIY